MCESLEVKHTGQGACRSRKQLKVAGDLLPESRAFCGGPEDARQAQNLPTALKALTPYFEMVGFYFM